MKENQTNKMPEHTERLQWRGKEGDKCIGKSKSKMVGKQRKNEEKRNCSFGKNGKRCQMQIDSFQYQFQNNRSAREGNEIAASEKKNQF